MPSNKVIKRRLASVKTTKKIMRALDMVAASKLQNCKNRLEHARSFLAETEKILSSVKIEDCLNNNVLLNARDVKNSAYLVLTSERGMCGGFNSNLLEFVNKHMLDGGKGVKILTIGAKGNEHYKQKRIAVYQNFNDIMETAFYEDAVRVSHVLRSLFISGEVDEVYVAFTEFESAFAHTPKVRKFLPIEAGTEYDASLNPMVYDQEVLFFLDHAIPAFLNTFIYTALLESIACENAARMLSMDAAVNNATDIIDKLTLAYNRKRQTAITQEISEIISGWQ